MGRRTDTARDDAPRETGEPTRDDASRENGAAAHDATLRGGYRRQAGEQRTYRDTHHRIFCGHPSVARGFRIRFCVPHADCAADPAAKT